MVKLFETFYTICFAALSLVCVSCADKDPVPSAKGVISVTIVNSEAEVMTKAPSLSDGSLIAVGADKKPDLAVALANSDGDLIAWWPQDFWGTMAGQYDSDLDVSTYVANTPVSESTIFFTGPTRGTYTVYAIANKAGLSADTITAIKAATTVSALDALTLSVASGQPDFGGCMPLTAKGTLSVNSSSNGVVDLDLLRPVARVSLTFRNLTGNDDLEIRTCQATIQDMNPLGGYLFSKATDYLTGGDRDLVLQNGGPLVFEDYKATVADIKVFPSVAPTQMVGSRYLCTIVFRVTKEGKTYDAGDSDTYHEYTFPDLAVHDSRSQDIQYVKRNQHLKIETRITKRVAAHDVSFNFEVQSWDTSDNYVVFD